MSHQRLKSVICTNAGFKIETTGGRYRFFVDVENIFDVGVPFPAPANGGSVTYPPFLLQVVTSYDRRMGVGGLSDE